LAPPQRRRYLTWSGRQEKVLEVLKASKNPLRNVEIRRAIFGDGNEEKDRAGIATSEALQALKLRKLVALIHGSRWGLVDVIGCPACEGHGHLPRERAQKLGLLDKK
jgi:hypothetical protein